MYLNSVFLIQAVQELLLDTEGKKREQEWVTNLCLAPTSLEEYNHTLHYSLRINICYQKDSRYMYMKYL